MADNKKEVHKFTRDGSRLYLNPNTEETVPSVTSIVDMLPQPHLRFWGQRVVAECAVRNIDGLPTLLETNGEKAVIEFLKKAPGRDTADAASMGSTAHAMFEALSQDQEYEYPEEVLEDEEATSYLDGYVEMFLNFLETVDPEFLYTEETVWSETHGYAGSFDAVVQLSDLPKQTLERLGLSPKRRKPVIAMLDYKTSRSGVYPSVALQINAYNRADKIMRGDGSSLKIPTCDLGLVLNIRPDYWRLYPVALDDRIFETFLALRSVKEWEMKWKKGALDKKPLYESDTF